MIIVLIRHGTPKTEGISNEFLYPLSEEGKKNQLVVGRKLEEKKIFPSYIFSSPFIRAKESAEILSNLFQIPLQEIDCLGSLFNPRALIEFIKTFKHNETLFLVGHAPSLSPFAESLVGKSFLRGEICRSGAIVLEFINEVGYGKGKLVEYVKP